jgi:uncharacterized protein (TIGR02270 family)
MAVAEPCIIKEVIEQHIQEAASLHALRATQVNFSLLRLHQLLRFDDRLAAHIDAVSLAGKSALHLSEAELELPSAGAVFIATIASLQCRSADVFYRLLHLSKAVSDAFAGFKAAFAWVTENDVRTVSANLIKSQDPFHRLTAVAVCAMRRLEPSVSLADLMQDADAAVRARALRAAGELGKAELMPWVVAGMADEHPIHRFWAARSAVLLGNRRDAIDQLRMLSASDHVVARAALRLLLQVSSVAEGHQVLMEFSQQAERQRILVEGAGLVGDPTYLRWLVARMEDPELARCAGESFSLITGLDLVEAGLDRESPEGVEVGPNDDPDSDNVAMEEDDELPWPDPEKIESWLHEHAAQYVNGVRYFAGAPLQPQRCLDVLRNAGQRVRITAATHLSILRPTTPLFEWRAPVRCQLAVLDSLP